VTYGHRAAAAATSEQACCLREDVMRVEMLPVAKSQPAGFKPAVWQLTTQLIDALAERADFAQPDWPSRLIGIDSLPRSSPWGCTRLAKATAEGELCPPSCAGSASGRFGFCLR
jgi:hypothetical protein